MNTGRRTTSQAEEVALVAQVENVCPECGDALFYKKNSRSYKHYEIAHIYPLNPTEEEASLLKDEERLGEDVNDVDNLIPLCLGCHGKFDKPRTIAEYRELLQKKKEIITHAEMRRFQSEYQLQEDIGRIVEALDQADFLHSSAKLALNAKPLDEKFNDTMPRPTRRKIHHNVSDYFVEIRKRFQRLDRENPGTASLILSQVKTFYLAQKQQGWSQQQIFTNVVGWIVTRTRPQTVEAAEIVASFFVQHCEVFE